MYLTLPFQEDEHFIEAIWHQTETFLLLGRKLPSVISEGMGNSQTQWDMCCGWKDFPKFTGKRLK